MLREQRRLYKTLYEQCPWDQDHVGSIYRNLHGMIVVDGQWHAFPPMPQHIGQYRVYNQQYFQAVYARSYNPVFEALLAMSPVDTKDDAEWIIWKLTWAEKAYALTSPFAVTPGPFEHHAEVADWLYRHGLGLVYDNTYGLRGVAYFTDIEPGCLRDAMDRLVWLENAIIHLNLRLEQISQDFWGEAKRDSDVVLDQLPSTFPSDEIVPVPERFRRMGWKHRESL